jgi:hypothetical protein
MVFFVRAGIDTAYRFVLAKVNPDVSGGEDP